MTKVFVTGGTGLLGADLIRKLLESGLYEVHALKRSSSSLELVEDIESRVKWLDGDILDIEVLENGIKDASIVFHCAAMVSFDPRDVEQMMAVNIEGTANVVNICLENPGLKLIHVSSIAALGHPKKPGLKVTEEDEWIDDGSRSNYSKSKYLSEMEVHRGVAEGLNASIVNPSVILGRGFLEKGSTKMFKNVYNKFPYYTEGVTGFIDVSDVATFMLKLAAMEATGERYLLSQGNYSYRQIFDWIAEGFNVPKPHKQVGPIVRALVWRLDYIRCLFTGSKPLVTRETTKSAFSIQEYDNSKSLGLDTFEYGDLKIQIKHICKQLSPVLDGR